jgi:hypothetical protein
VSFWKGKRGSSLAFQKMPRENCVVRQSIPPPDGYSKMLVAHTKRIRGRSFGQETFVL